MDLDLDLLGNFLEVVADVLARFVTLLWSRSDLDRGGFFFEEGLDVENVENVDP